MRDDTGGVPVCARAADWCEVVTIPAINVYGRGWLVDAHWPTHRLVVEIDGYDGHRTRAQLEIDHQRDLELRAAGYTVLRYTERQLIERPDAVAADIRRHLYPGATDCRGVPD